MGTSRNQIGGDGRGTHLARQLAALPGVEIAYVCDVDKRNIDKAIASVLEHQDTKPRGVTDFRHILDDKAVDALVIATPDHWHAPAAIAACAAGKHVYVEKPCSHNAEETLWLVEAARKHGRVVQHGTQRRSWPAVQEAIAKLHGGIIIAKELIVLETLDDVPWAELERAYGSAADVPGLLRRLLVPMWGLACDWPRSRP